MPGRASPALLPPAEDLARDVLVVIDDDTAGIDHLEGTPIVHRRPMDGRA
jgi:hypothetical protein